MCEGDVRAWIEQETIHMKVVDRGGDPVELNESEVQALIEHLVRLSKKIVGPNAGG